MTAGPLELVRAALAAAGQGQAVLCHPETLARLGVFEQPFEDWPVSNPFVAGPALLCLGREAVLVVAHFHAANVRPSAAHVVTYRSYDYRTPPDPSGELRSTLLAALDQAGVDPGPTGVEARALPLEVAEWLRESGRSPVDCADAVADTSAAPSHLEAVRRASRLADVVQQAVKDHAAPGASEAELAGLAAAAMFREAGRRVPAILTVSPPPQKMTERNRLMTTTVTMEERMARPEATPTPAGPPEA